MYCTTVVRQAAASFICGLIHGRLLVGPDLSRRPVAMAGDQPVGIVPGGEIQQRQAQLLDGLEVAHPQEVFLECTDERSATPLPSGWRTKDGEASMPRKAISLWKSSDI